MNEPNEMQRVILEACHLNPNNWYVTVDTERYLFVVHRRLGTTRTLRKPECHYTNKSCGSECKLYRTCTYNLLKRIEGYKNRPKGIYV